MWKTDAWLLPMGDPDVRGPGELRLGTVEIEDINGDEVMIEPLIGAWEANMSHAIERVPVDVCRQRGEPHVVLGNAGIVRVLSCGSNVTHVREGDVCTFHGAGHVDRRGYMVWAHGYDSPGTVGLLARRTKCRGPSVHRIPDNSRFSLQQWAAFSLKYPTAWSNWRLAYGTYRLQVREQDVASPFVWSWGGGTSFAELKLALCEGCQATMVTSRPERTAVLEAHGIASVDRREFADLSIAAAKAPDTAAKQRYKEAEARFAAIVKERTQGAGVSIFLDYIGGPSWRATLRVMDREGVIASAGWKLGWGLAYNRAAASIKRTTFVHTHYAGDDEIPDCVAYAEEHGWGPDEPTVVYAYEDVPQLAADFSGGRIDSFDPLFLVNPR